jgi:magnesium transporter
MSQRKHREPGKKPFAAPGFSQQDLDGKWIRVHAEDDERIEQVGREYGIEFPTAYQTVGEDDDSIYLSVTAVVPEGQGFHRKTIAFALCDRVVVTLEPDGYFTPFDMAIARFRRHPSLTRTTYGIMRTLLQAINDTTALSVDLISNSLETLNDRIAEVTTGYDAKGREIGVSDISGTMLGLNEREEIISQCQETQIHLARAARYLRMEIGGGDAELNELVVTLISDIDGVKQHASFEHEKVRYLQQSIITSLNIKQNQISKVFTIITAVFLPPTLIAAFYGMNFSVMPEFAWAFGFPACVVFCALAALLPLIYIKMKGWLR